MVDWDIDAVAGWLKLIGKQDLIEKFHGERESDVCCDVCCAALCCVLCCVVLFCVCVVLCCVCVCVCCVLSPLCLSVSRV